MPKILTTCVYCGCGCNLYLDVEEGRVVYVAKAYKFKFMTKEVLVGWASLTRYDVQEEEKKGGVKFFKNLPWLKRESETQKKFNQIWTVDTGFSRAGELGEERFISLGGVVDNYRKKLIGNAANMGITLSHQLMDAAFDPIDKAVMEMYGQVNK